MSVENKRIVDFITKEENTVVLTISDHLEWDDGNEHIYLLQEKINAYLMAVESGQLNQDYLTSYGMKVAIRVALKYEPNEIGYVFLSKVNHVLAASGYEFSYFVIK